MNRDQVQGKMKRIKGRAKKAWGELANDDSKKNEGSKDKLHGFVQEKVGDTKKAIKDGVDKLNSEKGETLLWTVAVILGVMWVLGLATSYTMNGFIHILLVLAVISVLINVIQGRRVFHN